MRSDRRHKPAPLETSQERRRRRLGAYGETHREAIARLAHAGSPLEDLADSFPALLFALATGYGTAAAREATIAAVAGGASLKTCAKMLDLPFWMRHLPAGALTAPMPRLPGDAEFSAAAIARMPTTEATASAWLTRTSAALQVAGHDAAIWVMKNPRFLPPGTSLDELMWVLAWIWHSMHPHTRAGRLIRRTWSTGLGWSRARDEVALWRKRIDLAAALGDGLDDTWFENGSALGYDFVALRTIDDFIAESAAMENCLDQYASQLMHGHVRVFSIRKDGRSVADVELTTRTDELAVPAIAQLRGRRNRQASLVLWQAAHAWLGAQRFVPLACRPRPLADVKAARVALWQDFLAAVRDPVVVRRLRRIAVAVDKQFGTPLLRLPAAYAVGRPARVVQI